MQEINHGNQLKLTMDNILDQFEDDGVIQGIGMILIETPGSRVSRIHYPLDKDNQKHGNLLDKYNARVKPHPAASLFQQLRTSINQTHAQDMLVLLISNSEAESELAGTMLGNFKKLLDDLRIPYWLVTPGNKAIAPHLVLG